MCCLMAFFNALYTNRTLQINGRFENFPKLSFFLFNMYYMFVFKIQFYLEDSNIKYSKIVLLLFITFVTLDGRSEAETNLKLMMVINL